MYDFIRGQIEDLTAASVVLDCGGVGYHINITLQTFSKIDALKEVKLYTHYIVREDAQLLYGFFSKDERDIFRLLISVSGVGGNTARMILSTYSPEELRSIIATENATLLKNVKGLGLKSAQKIIVEIKDKISGINVGTTISVSELSNKVYDEAISALTMLGFTRAASDKAIRVILKERADIGVEELIRTALKRL